MVLVIVLTLRIGPTNRNDDASRSHSCEISTNTPSGLENGYWQWRQEAISAAFIRFAHKALTSMS